MTLGERVRKRYAEWRLACSKGHNPTVSYTRYLPVIRLVRYSKGKGQTDYKGYILQLAGK